MVQIAAAFIAYSCDRTFRPVRSGSIVDGGRSQRCIMNSDELDNFDKLLDRAAAQFNHQVCSMLDCC